MRKEALEETNEERGDCIEKSFPRDIADERAVWKEIDKGQVVDEGKHFCYDERSYEDAEKAEITNGRTFLHDADRDIEEIKKEKEKEKSWNEVKDLRSNL